MVLEVIGIGQREFGFLFISSRLLSYQRARRRRGGNVGPDGVGIQARWKGWETRLGFLSFPRFPRGGISTALFTSSSSEPVRCAQGKLRDGGHCSLPRFLRMDSPRISMRWALCTSRSRMLSARVGSPICSCHLATGSWLVKIIERRW